MTGEHWVWRWDPPLVWRSVTLKDILWVFPMAPRLAILLVPLATNWAQKWAEWVARWAERKDWRARLWVPRKAQWDALWWVFGWVSERSVDAWGSSWVKMKAVLIVNRERRMVSVLQTHHQWRN